jgi:hypothetical protein
MSANATRGDVYTRVTDNFQSCRPGTFQPGLAGVYLRAMVYGKLPRCG